MKNPELSTTTFNDLFPSENMESKLSEPENDVFKYIGLFEDFKNSPSGVYRVTAIMVQHGSDIQKEMVIINPKKEKDFITYSKLWKQETGGLSSPSTIRMNRNYQKIIALGDSIIPLILRELKKEPDDWLYALEMLADDKENPVTEEMGFNESVSAWLKWGKEKRLI